MIPKKPKVNAAEAWIGLKDKLRNFIHRQVRDEELTNDLLQEIFIKIHASIDSVKDNTKLQSWIYSIANHLVADHFREKQRQLPVPAVNLVQEEEMQLDYMAEALSDMAKMMDEMPAVYCEALCLTELGGLSQKEYAKRAGISYSGAKSRVQRGKAMLKDLLMRCCHYEFDRYGTVLDIHPKHCCCCYPEKES